MFASMQARILAAVTGILFLTVISLVYFTHRQATKSIESLQDHNARNLLNAVTLNVQNEYNSIEFFREKNLKRRKETLKNIVDLSFAAISHEYKRKDISPAEAQKNSLEIVRKMRYADDVGYLWINDTTLPYPKMIMHPTQPELDGKVLDMPEFNCAMGKSENLFVAAVTTSMKNGDGYVDYLWAKPLPSGLSDEQPKLSYVRLFKPWNWVVGTGVYIDDIEKDTKERLHAVIDELKSTFQNVKLGESGYMFIISGNKDILIHPKLEGLSMLGMINPETGRQMFDDITRGVKDGKECLNYSWTKPDPGKEQLYKKRLYVKYFEPLDWYICASYYISEAEEPVWELSKNMLHLSIWLFIIAFIISIILSKNLSSPLARLSDAAEKVDEEGIEATDIPISGSLETKELGFVLSKTLSSLMQKEISIRENEENLRTTLESIADGVIATDTNGCITSMNKIAEHITGYSFSEVKGHSLLKTIKMLDPETHELAANPINTVLESKEPSNISTRSLIVSPTGEKFLTESNCSPIRNNEGKVIGAVMAIRDMTEKSEMEERLRQSQKMDSLGRLAGGVAHDFNNMLGGIMASAELLSGKISQSDTDKQHFLKLIIDTSERAADLTDKLLTFSRKGRLVSQPMDIHKPIDDAIAILERSIDKRISIEITPHAEHATINGDISQIQNIILNLGLNAKHAMPDGGVLSISTRNMILDEYYCKNSPFDLKEGEYVEISIKDTGKGISRNIMGHIFEPFFTTKGIGQGTGLGLAAVYGSVKEHHGAITVYSEPGKGALFNIYLPTIETATTKSPKPQEPSSHRGEGCIMVADDEEVILMTAQSILEDMGYEVLVARDGEEAIKVFEENQDKVNTVLLDMSMPRISGKESLLAIRKIKPKIKAIIASGYVRDEDQSALQESGVVGFLKKPYHKSELIKLLNSIQHS